MDKPTFRLDETQYSDDRLIPTNTEFWRRVEFRQEIQKRTSSYYLSAIQSIDAALQLLVTCRLSQSYLLFFQALELSLKGVLDEIKNLGISAWMGRNPLLAKQLANNSKDEFLTDIRDLPFRKAYEGTKAITNFSSFHSQRIAEINRVRNEIVHRGGDNTRDYYYLDLILCNMLPLLDQFYKFILNLDLADWVLHPIARELIVAAKYRRQTPNDPKYLAQCVNSFQAAYFRIYRIGEVGVPNFDEQGFSKFDVNSDEYYRWQKACLRSLAGEIVNYKDFDNSIYNEANTIHCHICHEECFVTTDWDVVNFNDQEGFRITEIVCPYCRLNVTDPLFAQIHYGTITRNLLGRVFWDKMRTDNK